MTGIPKFGERYFVLDIDNIDANSYQLIVHGFRFNRKIYQPCEIEAEISLSKKGENETLTKPTVTETVNLLLREKVTLTCRFKGAIKSISLAENYYIHEVLPQEKKGCDDQLFAKLTIFSMDKLMTLDKYSKAYVSKKLGSEILAEERKEFKLNKSASTTGTDNPDIDVAFDKMNMLKYTFTRTLTNSMTGKTIDIQIQSEFIQPYLVQYNESFYDFLARTANRCGEFLYFEDGRLNLGLTPRMEKNNNTEIEIEPRVIDDYDLLTYQKVSSSAMDIGSYARDSMKEKSTEKQETNYDVVKKNAAGYPHDAFPDHPSYNLELTSDEFFFPLYADKFSTIKRETGFVGNDGDQAAHFLMPLLSSLTANSKDVFDFLADLGVSESMMYGFADKSNTKKNDTGFTEYIKIKDTAVRAKMLEKTDGQAHAVPFGTLSEDGWTTLDYYRDIRKYEEELQRDIICIDMDTNFVDVKLGDKIRLVEGGDLYVVIQILLVNDAPWTRTYEKYGGEIGSKTEAKQNQKIFAIPCRKMENGEYKAYPPVLDAPIVRKAEPQTAFVTANKDPKYQGRVRIVYPWQTESQGKLKELAEAEAKYAEEVKKQAERKEQLAIIKAELDALKKEKADLEKTGTEKQQVINQRKQEKKDNIDQEITDLDKDIKELDKTINDTTATAEKKEEATAKKKHLEEKKEDLKKIQEAQKDYIDKLETSKTDTTILEDIKKEIEVKDGQGNLTGGKQKEYNDLLKEIKTAEGKDGDLYKAKKAVDEKVDSGMSALKAISSPWIRIATPMATEGGGTLFKPRAGDEVLINYDSGNIERPYVIGSLFSKNVLEPDERINRQVGPALHKGASIAIVSPNGHGITFKDPDSGDGFVSSVYPGLGLVSTYFDGWGDKLPKESKDLAGGISISDRYGLYSIDMSSDKRSIKIKSSMGTVTLNAFTGITISAPNGDVKIEGKNVSIKAGNNLTLTSGANIDTRKKMKKKVWGITKLERGAVVEDMILSRVIKEFVTPFIDVSLARTVWETILRPIEGTTLIKSHRYLKLEAGSGKAMIQHDRYTTVSIEAKTQKLMVFIKQCIKDIDTMITGFCTNYRTLWSDGYTAMDTYNNNANEVNDPQKNIYLKTPKTPSKDDIVNEAKDLAEQAVKNGFLIPQWYDWDDKDDLFKNKLKDAITVPDKESYLDLANGVGKNVYELIMYIRLFGTIYTAPANLADSVEKDVKNALNSSLLSLADACQKEWNDYYDNTHKGDFLSVQSPSDIFSKDTFLKRKWVGLFLLQIKKTELSYKFILNLNYKEENLSEAMLTNDMEWNTFVNALSGFQNPLVKTTVDDLLKPLKDSFIPFANPILDMKMWSENASGQILLSDDPDCTVKFDKGHLDTNGNHLATFDEETNQSNFDEVKKKLVALN